MKQAQAKKKSFNKSFRDLFLHPSSLTLKPNRNWEKIKLWKYVFLQITSQPKKRPPGGALVSVRSSALRILPQLEILHLQGQDGLGTKGPGRNVNQPLMSKLFTSTPTYPSNQVNPLAFLEVDCESRWKNHESTMLLKSLSQTYLFQSFKTELSHLSFLYYSTWSIDRWELV